MSIKQEVENELSTVNGVVFYQHQPCSNLDYGVKEKYQYTFFHAESIFTVMDVVDNEIIAEYEKAKKVKVANIRVFIEVDDVDDFRVKYYGKDGQRVR